MFVCMYKKYIIHAGQGVRKLLLLDVNNASGVHVESVAVSTGLLSIRGFTFIEEHVGFVKKSGPDGIFHA
jgi:hypothetical protein